MTPDEKKRKAKDFWSDKLGPNAEGPLWWVSKTIRAVVFGVVIDKYLIEQALFEGTPLSLAGDDRELLANYLYVDAMAKTVTITETFLAFCHTFGFHKNRIADNLVNTPDIISIAIKALDECFRESGRNKTGGDILSLPEIDRVGDLKAEERELLMKLSNASIQKLIDDYEKIKEFYENHRIVYNKLRHGMSVYLGIPTAFGTANFAFDSRPIKRPPPNLVTIESSEYPWGRTIGILKVNERALQMYELHAKGAASWVQFLIGSVMSFAENSGEGYLPGYLTSEGIVVPSYSPNYDVPQNEREIFDRICDKVKPNYVQPNMRVIFDPQFGPKYFPQVNAMLDKFGSATVRFTGQGQEGKLEYWRTSD